MYCSWVCLPTAGTARLRPPAARTAAAGTAGSARRRAVAKAGGGAAGYSAAAQWAGYSPIYIIYIVTDTTLQQPFPW